jgi:hypothetical protein
MRCLNAGSESDFTNPRTMGRCGTQPEGARVPRSGYILGGLQMKTNPREEPLFQSKVIKQSYLWDLEEHRMGSNKPW